MAAKLADAIAKLIVDCPYIVSLQDLITKTRLELEQGYTLDLYYNEAMGKYAYALILNNKRVMGWDNAPHHPELKNFPHHFHTAEGKVEASALTGDPGQDISWVIQAINAIMQQP